MTHLSNRIIENFIDLVNIVKEEGDDSGLTLEQVNLIMDFVGPELKREVVEKFLIDDDLVEITIKKEYEMEKPVNTNSIFYSNYAPEKVLLIKALKDLFPFISIGEGVDIYEKITYYKEYTLPYKCKIFEKRRISDYLLHHKTGFKIT